MWHEIIQLKDSVECLWMCSVAWLYAFSLIKVKDINSAEQIVSNFGSF